MTNYTLVQPFPMTIGGFSAPPDHSIAGTISTVTGNGVSVGPLGRGIFAPCRVFFVTTEQAGSSNVNTGYVA